MKFAPSKAWSSLRVVGVVAANATRPIVVVLNLAAGIPAKVVKIHDGPTTVM